MKLSFVFFLFISLCVTSCGYRIGPGEIAYTYSSICVPYVEGDVSGIMTNALIRSFSQTGALTYRACGADLLLKVCLFLPSEELIGFIYAPGDRADNFFPDVIVSNEARITLTAKVTLCDKKTGAALFGPSEITSFLEYDFESDFSNVNDHYLSLGQLEMHNLAQDAAFNRLCVILAEKIVDYVNHCW